MDAEPPVDGGSFEQTLTPSPAGTFVRISGELDIAAVPRLLTVLEHADGEIAVDCSGLVFIDAAGLGALVRGHHRCASRGASLVVMDPSPVVDRVMRLVDLETRLEVRRSGDPR